MLPSTRTTCCRSGSTRLQQLLQPCTQQALQSVDWCDFQRIIGDTCCSRGSVLCSGGRAVHPAMKTNAVTAAQCSKLRYASSAEQHGCWAPGRC